MGYKTYLLDCIVAAGTAANKTSGKNTLQLSSPLLVMYNSNKVF